MLHRLAVDVLDADEGHRLGPRLPGIPGAVHVHRAGQVATTGHAQILQGHLDELALLRDAGHGHEHRAVDQDHLHTDHAGQIDRDVHGRILAADVRYALHAHRLALEVHLHGQAERAERVRTG